MTKRRAALGILSVLFVLTGATALIIEQVFEKLLGTLVGTSTQASAIVLAVYFSGLTLGGWGYGKVRRLSANPLRLYGFLELGVGIWAVILYLCFDALFPALVPLLRLGLVHDWVLGAMRFLIAALWIVPPTFLMGATFPAIVEALERFSLPSRVTTRAMARFYSLNLVGAVGGTLAAPYILLPRIGLDRTLIAAAAVDLLVALVALRLARSPIFAAATGVEKPAGTKATREVRIVLAVAALSGFLFFALEVLWTHLITVVFGNSIYSFAIMLAVVLLGLFLGGFLATVYFGAARGVSAAVPGVLFVIAALLLLIQHRLWPRVPHWFTLWGGNLTSFQEGELLRWIIALLLILPVSVILGLVYPLLFRLRIFPRTDRAAVAGKMVALNAMGSVAGALVMVFLLIPRLGSEKTLALLPLIYALLGVLLAFLDAGRRARVFAAVAAVVVLLGLAALPLWDRLAVTSGEHTYFRPVFVTPQSKLLFFEEDSAGGITTVVENPLSESTAIRVLLSNGKFQGNDGGEREAQVALAVIPALHVEHPVDALVIGLGTGQSAEVIHKLGFGSIQVAEISSTIIQAAAEHFSHVNGEVLRQPNVELFVEDGRNHLLMRPRKFDLISMEVSSIWFAGATNLYSEEFYRLVNDRLKPGGVFQQWIQVHHIGPEELASAILTVRKVFPYVSFWVAGGQGIIVASREPQQIQAPTLRSLEANPAAFAWTADHLGSQFKRLLSTRILDADAVTAMASAISAPINTDRNRFLEYATPRYNLSRLPHQQLNVEILRSFAKASSHRLTPEAHQLITQWP